MCSTLPVRWGGNNDGGMSTYRNSFHSDNPYKSIGPEVFKTDATPEEYRGFRIYPRVPTSGRFNYGEIDAVIGGACVMISCTVQGAKNRIDKLLANDGEDRARRYMSLNGIAIPGAVKPGTQLQI